MSGAWSKGYVADVAYIEGYYPQQTPARMALACLLGNVAVEIPLPDDPAHYLELGCGIGIGALVTAASNPGWRVTAIDYNPAHIATANALARAARLENVRFLEADLSSLPGSALGDSIPAADFVTMHGVWSWVAPEVRAGIVRLLAEKTLPGAVVHISYNALPAWQGGLGLQRVIYEQGRRAGGRSDRQAQAGLKLARAIKEAGGQYLADSKLAANLLDHMDSMSAEYLSHEYMNANWAPCFHADVAAAMAGAKLDWVASANPLENFAELMLSAEQRALMAEHDDPILRELIKDSCLGRQLRHDVYVRGARHLSNEARDTAIAGLTLAPIVSPGELQTTLTVPAGTAEMSAALQELMAAALRGPALVGDLLERLPGRSSPPELAGVLVGTHQCQIMPAPGAAQPDSAQRLNKVLGGRIDRVTGPRSRGGLACGALGAGLAAPALVLFMAGRLLAGETEAQTEDWIAALSADVPEDKLPTLREMVHTAIAQRLPLLRGLGIVP